MYQVVKLHRILLSRSLQSEFQLHSCDSFSLCVLSSNLLFSYNPGDLALIIQTKDPGILVVVNCEKGRVFVDKDSIKGHEQDFKRAW